MKLNKKPFYIATLLFIGTINTLVPSEQRTKAVADSEKTAAELLFIKKLLMEEPVAHEQHMPTELTDHILSLACTPFGFQHLQPQEEILDSAISYHGDRIALRRLNSRALGSVSIGSLAPAANDSFSMFMPIGPMAISRHGIAIGQWTPGAGSAVRLHFKFSPCMTNLLTSPLIGLHILPCERATIGVTKSGHIIAWRNTTGNTIRHVADNREVSVAAFALRASKYVATGHHSSDMIHLWNLASCSRTQKRIETEWHGTQSLAITHNGEVVVASDNHRMFAWAPSTNTTIIINNAPSRTLDGFLRYDDGYRLISHDAQYSYTPLRDWIGARGEMATPSRNIKQIRAARTTLCTFDRQTINVDDTLVGPLKRTGDLTLCRKMQEERDRKDEIEKQENINKQKEFERKERQAQCHCILS